MLMRQALEDCGGFGGYVVKGFGSAEEFLESECIRTRLA